jgi:two-component system nitrogen regulation response regulator NtrX
VVKVDMRVVSSSARAPAGGDCRGRFREDLYYRSTWCRCTCRRSPNGREDIPELVTRFAARYAAERRVQTPTISPDALAALQAYDWPGNVRQLRNVIERTIILAPGERIGNIEIDMLPPELLSDQAQINPGEAVKAIMGTPLREARETFEREYLRVQIRRFSGNISRTASFIGMERSALHRKLKALGLGESRSENEE